MRVSHAIVFILVTGCGRLGFDDGNGFVDTGLGPDPSAANWPIAPEPPSLGLVAHWSFDTDRVSDVSADVADCSGAECGGQAIGAVGMAAAFDGANTCYHVPSLSAFASPAFTMSVWTKVGSVSVDEPMVMRYTSGCSSPSMRTHNATFAFAAYDVTDTHQYAWTGDVIQANTWQHVAVRYDGTNQTVFIDGVCSCNFQPGMPLVVAPNTEFTFGCDMNDGKRMGGALDELRIYDRALTDDEIAILGAADGRVVQAARPCPTTCAVTNDFPP